MRGLDVTITTTAKTDGEAFALLEAFGMPFTRDGRGPLGDQAAAAPPNEGAADTTTSDEEQEA